MKRLAVYVVLLLAAALVWGGRTGTVNAESSNFEVGAPHLESMSALTFGPDGVLFIGDGKAGRIFAIDLQEERASGDIEGVRVQNIETQIAALLGTSASEVMIHDMAVNPVSQKVYLAVSRGRSAWNSRWELPNDVADANVLVRVTPAGEIEAVSLDAVRFAYIDLPNPVDPAREHPWKKGTPLRSDTVTDMALAEGTLYVAGLSNEEFSSTMWRVPYPFTDGIGATTLEIFHGAHGEFETHAPIRSFVPYRLNGREHLLAAYLCTPFVTFEVSELRDGQHVKGRTVAEFGYGNYPLDMIVYQKDGEDRVLIANSNLPFMIIDPKDVAAFEGSITEEVKEYMAGVGYEPRSGTGIQQLDKLNGSYVLALQRLPGGTLDLVSMETQRF